MTKIKKWYSDDFILRKEMLKEYHLSEYLLVKTFGCCRFVLGLQHENYQNKVKHRYRRSFTTNVTNTNIQILDGAVKLPKLGKVKAVIRNTKWISIKVGNHITRTRQ